MNTKARNYANKKHCESCRKYRFCESECKKWVNTYFDYQNGLETGRKEREDEIKQVEQVNENRGAFIDWCAANHEEILKKYTGFLEAGK